MSSLASNSAVAEATPSSADASVEVDRLRSELEQVRAKFLDWKSKAQSGVDQLRRQIVELNDQLESGKRERLQWQWFVGRLLSAFAVSQLEDSRGGMTGLVGQWLLHSCDYHRLVLDSFIDAASSNGVALKSKTDAASPSPLPQPTQPSTETLSRQVEQLQGALAKSSGELQQKVQALHRQDEILAALKRQIESLESANRALESQLSSGDTQIDEIQQAHEALSEEMRRMSQEYESREAALALRHGTELQALTASHEVELQQVRDEATSRLNEMIQQSLRDGIDNTTSIGLNGTRAANDNDDVAYTELLGDYKAMETRCTALAEENRVLQEQIRNTSMGGGKLNGGGLEAKDLGSHENEPLNFSDAVRQLTALRIKMSGLQEELWKAKREALATAKKSSAQSNGLSSQNVEYLRSVIVRLLCSQKKPDVVMHLIPVLSMLLKLPDSDLREVYVANPSWVRKT